MEVFMRFIIIFLLLLISITPCFSLTEKEREANRKKLREEMLAKPKNKINSKIPKFPPNFLELSKIIKFEISDYTDGLKANPLGKNAEFSAVWTRYFKLSKKWDELNEKKKEKFIKLRDKIILALKHGIKNNGGTVKIIKFDENMFKNSGMVEVTWKVTHKKEPLISIWSVKLTSAYNLFDNTPYINIYIAHSKI